MAVEHEQVGVIATVILAVIVGAIGTVIYLIFLKPCTDVKEEDSDKRESNKDLTKKHDEGMSKKRPNSTSSSSKKKVAKESNSVTTHGLLLTSLKGHTGTVTCIDFSSNGKYLASCSEGKAFKQ